MAPADVQALVSQCPDRDAELKKTSRMVVSASPEGSQAAFTLRPRGGDTQVTGGLYAEAMELMGGIFIIEAAVRDETMQVASLHPLATMGETAG